VEATISLKWGVQETQIPSKPWVAWLFEHPVLGLLRTSKRTWWTGYVARVEDVTNPCRILAGKPEIPLKCMFLAQGRRVCSRIAWLRVATTAGCCERSNGHLVRRTCWPSERPSAYQNDCCMYYAFSYQFCDDIVWSRL
jgi:hypothetical protein